MFGRGSCPKQLKPLAGRVYRIRVRYWLRITGLSLAVLGFGFVGSVAQERAARRALAAMHVRTDCTADADCRLINLYRFRTCGGEDQPGFLGRTFWVPVNRSDFLTKRQPHCTAGIALGAGSHPGYGVRCLRGECTKILAE